MIVVFLESLLPKLSFVSQKLLIIGGILLMLSITLCSFKRILSTIKTKREDQNLFLAKKGSKHFFLSPLGIDQVTQMISGSLKLFSVTEVYSDDKISVFNNSKKINRGIWGSIMFHLGMVIVVLSMIFITLYGIFSGFFIAAEGQKIQLKDRNFVSIYNRNYINLLKDITVQPLNLEPKLYRGRENVDFLAVIEASSFEQKVTRKVNVNKPLYYQGVKFILKNFGFSPHFEIRRGGEKIFDSYVNLDATGGRRDYFTISNLKVGGAFYPDLVRVNGVSRSRTYELRNPSFDLEVFERGKRVFSKLVHIGKEVQYGKYIIKIPDVKHWAGFNVTVEREITPFIAGLVMVFLGLLLRVTDIEMAIYLRLKSVKKGTAVEMYGHGIYFSTIVKQRVERLWNELLKRLSV